MTTTPQNEARLTTAPIATADTAAPDAAAGQLSTKERSTRFAKGLFTTIPIVLAGSMAMSLNLTGPIAAADLPADKDKPGPTELGKTIRQSLAAAHAASTAEATNVGVPVVAAAAPATYRVVAGDSISGIAGRFGLATASVLALNGLGWKSVIFPGQTLTLTNGAVAPVAAAPAPVAARSGTYKIVAGDTINGIAAKFKIPAASLLSANGLRSTSIIYAGRTLTVPGQSTAASASQTPIAPPTVIAPVASVTPAPGAATSAHVIKAGETIGSISRAYGVSVQAILSANGLGWSSIIYSGRSLVIPSVAVAAAVTPGVSPLSPTMARNARTIIAVGKSLGVSDQGLVIALATAMQESSLENLNYGDRDSLGLFQQRPSTGWGTPAQVTDPVYAAKLFFGGPSNPNRGITRGLLDIPSWQSISLTKAAQAVQLSAYPDAYAKWETSAKAWLDQLT